MQREENKLFNAETCTRCGTCLNQCPFMLLHIEEAQNEVSKMIETKSSEAVIEKCGNCLFCDIICPTQSNPSALTKEIQSKNYLKNGVENIRLMTEENPTNIMSLSLEVANEELKKDVELFSNPPNSKALFFVGCSITYFYPDLVKSKILEEFPVMGGLEYCCGAYAERYFGDIEGRIKGTELFEKFKKLEVEKLITFCPGCERAISKVYPTLVDGYNIENQNIINYLIEKYHEGELDIKNKINQRITFQDPCNWRERDKKIYEAPRELLEILGCEVVEMKHNKEHSLCCGSPVRARDMSLGKKIGRKNILEAKEIEADAIAFVCQCCLSTLALQASNKKIETYYITELAQMAIGEKIPHTQVESMEKIQNYIFKRILEDPNIMKQHGIVKNGKIIKI